MFKFCTKCGARMPQENLFCTQCGAKFATDEQAVSRVKIVDITAPSGGQLPKQTVNKSSLDEFILGREFMNTANPLHDYEKAIVHLKNAVNMGKKEAAVYLALAHLYLAADIIKNNPAVMAENANMLSAVHSALPTANAVNNMPGNNHGRNTAAHNNQQNNTGSTLQNMGKYAAAAAVGAVAGSMLRSATASAAGSDVPGNITSEDLAAPDLAAYADETVQDASAYVPPLDNAADHIQAYDDTTEVETEPIEDSPAADSIEPAEDDGGFFDSGDNSDDGGLFDDLFE